MKISYQLQLQDVIALQKYLLIRSKKNRILKKLTQAVVPVILAGVIVAKLMQNSFVPQSQIILLVLVIYTELPL